MNDAQNDPNIIELQFKEKDCSNRVAVLSEKQDGLKTNIINLDRDISELTASLKDFEHQIAEIERLIQQLSNGDSTQEKACYVVGF